MKKKITIDHKEYEMQKMSIAEYMEYLNIVEEIDTHTRYTGKDIENMCETVCKVYGNQFTKEELMNPETGLEPADLILEFQMIDMGVAQRLTEKMETIQKNMQTAS